MDKGTYNRVGGFLMLAAFVLAGLMRFPSGSGDDLSASYIGCRLLATGQGGHLYQHDPRDFSAIGPDAPWQAAADSSHFDGDLHPYVQTPLWAWSLEPVCMRTDFAQFQRLFSVVAVLCFAALVWMIAWFWTPRLFTPMGMAVVLAGLWLCVPFQYAMGLMQTHVLFVAMTVAALILAERGKPGWAGLLLAGAAAVKLTPGVLLVYWLLTRRWKAAVSLMGWSAVILGVTVAAVGPGLVAVYLADLQRISRILLVTENNQSFAAWWMGRFYPLSAIAKIDILPLPAAMREASIALLLGLTVLGGWIDRRREAGAAPLGAMIALVAATVFAPIAWTHYSIVLVAPLMVLWQENLRVRSGLVWAGMACAVALTLQPLAPDVANWVVGRYSLLRSEFYAGVICLGILGLVGWRRKVSRRGVERSAAEVEARFRQRSRRQAEARA